MGKCLHIPDSLHGCRGVCSSADCFSSTSSSKPLVSSILDNKFPFAGLLDSKRTFPGSPGFSIYDLIALRISGSSTLLNADLLGY